MKDPLRVQDLVMCNNSGRHGLVSRATCLPAELTYMYPSLQYERGIAAIEASGGMTGAAATVASNLAQEMMDIAAWEAMLGLIEVNWIGAHGCGWLWEDVCSEWMNSCSLLFALIKLLLNSSHGLVRGWHEGGDWPQLTSTKFSDIYNMQH